MKNNKMIWGVVALMLATFFGVIGFVLRMPISNYREIGETKIEVHTLIKNDERQDVRLDKIEQGLNKIDVGQQVLIEKFKLEKEYKKKLDNYAKKSTN